MKAKTWMTLLKVFMLFLKNTQKNEVKNDGKPLRYFNSGSIGNSKIRLWRRSNAGNIARPKVYAGQASRPEYYCSICLPHYLPIAVNPLFCQFTPTHPKANFLLLPDLNFVPCPD
jgi:hypothetical protein